MKKRVGIWIDQRKSIIVSIVEKETVVKTIMSEVEKNITPSISDIIFYSRERLCGI